MAYPCSHLIYVYAFFASSDKSLLDLSYLPKDIQMTLLKIATYIREMQRFGTSVESYLSDQLVGTSKVNRWLEVMECTSSLLIFIVHDKCINYFRNDLQGHPLLQTMHISL